MRCPHPNPPPQAAPPQAGEGREGASSSRSTENGARLPKRGAVFHQLVNKSATADLRATNMLFHLIKDVEQKASVASPVPEPRRLDAADEGVVPQLVNRIRRQILAEMAAENIAAAGAV
jgi:hypothetical protein